MDVSELKELDQAKILYKGDWYVSVSKEFLFNTNISKDARFLFMILKSFTNPTNPVAFPGTKYLQNIMGIKTHTTLGSYMDELVKFGFVRKEQIKEKGKFARNIYELSEKPQFQPNSPLSDFSMSENSDSEKLDTNNNNINNNNNIEEDEKEEQSSLLDSEYIEITSIEDDKLKDIKKIVEKWNIIAIANNLEQVYKIQTADIPKIREFSNKYDIEQLREELPESKYLRGLGKGNKKSNALKFFDLINDNKVEFITKLFEGFYRDINHKASCLFEHSPYYTDFDKFEADMQKDPLFKEYQDADIKYYWEAVAKWSRKEGAKKRDWIAEAINFMRLDKDKNIFRSAEDRVEQSKTKLSREYED